MQTVLLGNISTTLCKEWRESGSCQPFNSLYRREEEFDRNRVVLLKHPMNINTLEKLQCLALLSWVCLFMCLH